MRCIHINKRNYCGALGRVVYPKVDCKRCKQKDFTIQVKEVKGKRSDQMNECCKKTIKVIGELTTECWDENTQKFDLVKFTDGLKKLKEQVTNQVKGNQR